MRRRRRRKGVRDGWEAILAAVEGARGAAGGVAEDCGDVLGEVDEGERGRDLGGVGGRPIAERIEGWEALLVFGFLVRGGRVELSVVVPSTFRLLLPCPFFAFPRAARLCSSSSTKSALPTAIASPSVMQFSSCAALMWFMAGLFRRSVQGAGLVPTPLLLAERVEVPTTASRIMRAKQWSRWTGQVDWEGALERARLGRVVW